MNNFKQKKLIKILEREDSDVGIIYNGYFLTTTMEGQQILEKARLQKKPVVCICKGDNRKNYIKMYIRRLNKNTHYSYILCRNPKTQHLHDPKCPNYDNILPYEKKDEKREFKENENITNKFVSNNKWKGFSIKTTSHIDKHKKHNPNKTIKNIEKKKTYQKYSPMFTIGETILSNAWAHYVMDKKNRFNPTEKLLFKTIYTKLTDFTLIDTDGNKDFLSNIMFHPYGNIKNQNIDDLIRKAWFAIYFKGKAHTRKGCFMYVLAKIINVINYNDKIKKLIVLDPFKKNTFTLYVPKDIYQENKKHIEKPTPETEYYVSSIVNMINNKLTIVELAIIPVLKGKGIYIDSNYEIQFAEELIRKNILFIKPPKSNNVYKSLFNKYIPNFLLIDKEVRQIATIVEIFGYYTDECWKKSVEKKKFYKTLKEYNFLYWDAGRGYALPNIYQPKIRRNNSYDDKFCAK